MTKLLFILSLCISPLIFANELSSSTVAKQWLNIIDAGNYAESWENSDSYLQSQISQNKWKKALKSARAPLGKVNSRLFNGAQEYLTLPGLPEGTYVVIQFTTKFQHKKLVTETLTLSKNSGEWFIIGYFLK